MSGGVRWSRSGDTRQIDARFSIQPDPTEVAAARRFVADTLSTWQAHQDRETAVLLVSELVSNAVVHARTDITITIRNDGALLTVEVQDGSDQLPDRHDAAPTATSGRGLAMVDRMAQDWGVRRLPGDGKVTWFTLVAEESVPAQDQPVGQSAGAVGQSVGAVGQSVGPVGR